MRDQINALKQKRAGLLQEMRDLTLKAESEDRDLTAEEAQEFDRKEQEADQLEKRAARLEAMAGIEPDDKLKRQIVNAGPADGDDGDEKRGVQSWAEYAQLRDERSMPQNDPEYREKLYRWLQYGTEFEPGTELRALSKATAAAGANLVPTDFEARMIERIVDFGVMRQLATIIRTDSGAGMTIPTETSHGVAAWTAENVAFNESDDAFGQTTLAAHKATRLVRVSEELLTDAAFDVEDYLNRSFARSFGILENTAYVVGDGTSKPRGITLDATAGKTGATGQTTSVTADDLVDLFHSVLPAFRRNGAWLMNDLAIRNIRKLRTGVSGDQTYLWQPGLQAGQPDTLLGRPVYADPDMPVMAANAKSILFGDFSAYWIREVRGVAFQRLNELYSANGQIGFRGFIRRDGRLIDTNAVKAYVNSAT